MNIFKKKKEVSMAETQPEFEVPITQVLNMQNQGLSNNQIIQTLQRQGFQSTQIYDALAQAEAKKSIEPMQQEIEMPKIQPSEETNSQTNQQNFFEPSMQMSQTPNQQNLQTSQELTQPTHSFRSSSETEALIEQIIEEKWHELQKETAKINEWKELIGSRIDKMEQSITDTKNDLEGLHKAIVSRIGEYDKTLLDVGTEIKAMEKVFQKVLPELSGNIQELSRITKNVKGK